ncbi:MAG: hypothetical protein ABIO79_04260 [Ferruginibacter sp.]
MKAIIYAGIGLFSVATVYGVADFYSSKKKGTLDKLYVEEEIPTTPKVEEKTTGVIPVKNTGTEAVENTVIAVKAKSAKKVRNHLKTIKMEDFSRARIPEPAVAEDLKLDPVKIEEVEVVPVKLTVKPEEKVEVKTEPVRKISLDKFSRAPLKRPVKKITLKD